MPVFLHPLRKKGDEVDNLENERIKKLLSEYSKEFDNHPEALRFLKTLDLPILQIQGTWKQNLPQAIVETWSDTSLSLRFSLAMLCQEIDSIGVIADDYRDAFYEASK